MSGSRDSRKPGSTVYKPFAATAAQLHSLMDSVFFGSIPNGATVD